MRFHSFPTNSTLEGKLLFFSCLKKKTVFLLFSWRIAVEKYFNLKGTEAVSALKSLLSAAISVSLWYVHFGTLVLYKKRKNTRSRMQNHPMAEQRADLTIPIFLVLCCLLTS